MIRFIPTSGAVVADTLSNALWSLSRPESVRSEKDTQRMFSPVTCLNGSVWLQVDTAFTITIHPLVELGDIAGIMQPWIDAGSLPKDENERLAAMIEDARGSRLNVYDSFPQLFRDQSKTRAELIALGLIKEVKP